LDSEEYLTIDEVAARLKIKPKTVKHKMAISLFRKGVHFFKPKGCRPLFKWSAVVAFYEAREDAGTGQDPEDIPMAQGYKQKNLLTEESGGTIHGSNELQSRR